MMNKRGQEAVGMSFGMIFAIILIVVFIVFAGIAINSFLDLGSSTNVGMFYDELQGAVDNAIKSQESDKAFAIDLPKGITHVCFGNLSAPITNQEFYGEIRNYEVYNANTFLYPPAKASGMEWKIIDKINVTKITRNQNPYCVSVDVDLRIKKSFYDRLVLIE